MTDQSRLERGLAIRREVLGDEYVDQSTNVTGFDSEFQELVTEFCWGTIWSREGLSRKERSLINVGVMAAINRPHELKIHVKGALNNGCTIAELQETIMQIAVYCGLPAGLDGLRVVKSVIGELGQIHADGAGSSPA